MSLTKPICKWHKTQSYDSCIFAALHKLRNAARIVMIKRRIDGMAVVEELPLSLAIINGLHCSGHGSCWLKDMVRMVVMVWVKMTRIRSLCKL